MSVLHQYRAKPVNAEGSTWVTAPSVISVTPVTPSKAYAVTQPVSFSHLEHIWALFKTVCHGLIVTIRFRMGFRNAFAVFRVDI